MNSLNDFGNSAAEKSTLPIYWLNQYHLLKAEFILFLNFLKKPSAVQHQSSNTYTQLRRFIVLLGFTIGFDLFFAGTVGLALGNFTDADYLPNITLGFLIFGGVIVAPILEELVFRAGLRSPTYTLFIGPIFICLLVGSWHFSLFFFLLAGVFTILWHFPKEYWNKKKEFNIPFFRGRQFVKHYPQIFYLYAITFALIHTTNFGINNISGILIIFFVIPQFVGALCMNYIRLRDGLGYAIALHSAHNLITYAIAQLNQLFN